MKIIIFLLSIVIDSGSAFAIDLPTAIPMAKMKRNLDFVNFQQKLNSMYEQHFDIGSSPKYLWQEYAKMLPSDVKEYLHKNPFGGIIDQTFYLFLGLTKDDLKNYPNLRIIDRSLSQKVFFQDFKSAFVENCTLELSNNHQFSAREMFTEGVIGCQPPEGMPTNFKSPLLLTAYDRILKILTLPDSNQDKEYLYYYFDGILHSIYELITALILLPLYILASPYFLAMMLFT